MNIRVAIVDDDRSVRTSLGRLLQATNIETKRYASAEEFMGDANRARFDCLLLDVQLGGMSGLDLQQRLRAEHYTVPIIFITAFEDPVAQAQAERIGCNGFFHKTDPGARIIRAIRMATEQAPPA